jgi:hypothetical protein
MSGCFRVGVGKAFSNSRDNSAAMGPKHSEDRRRSAIPEIGYCAEKNQLMNEFLQAIHALGELQSQQAKSLIEGDPDFARFDVLIHMANEKKDWVKYALLAHIEQHLC